MRKRIIRDIDMMACLDSEVVAYPQTLTLAQFVQACGQNEQWVRQLFEHDILQTVQQDLQGHQFIGEELSRARKAYRIQRDFDASFHAVALILEMLDELQRLRKRVAY